MTPLTQFNKGIRCGLVLIAMLTIFAILCVTVPVSASDAGEANPARIGSVSLTVVDSDGNTVPGGEFTIYEIATLYDEDGEMAYARTDDFQDCNAVLDTTDTFLAATLAQYVEENGISGISAWAGMDGTVTFDGLEIGMYLIVQTTVSDNGRAINPFVISTPMEVKGEWVYDMEVNAKAGLISEDSEDTEEPEDTTEPENETAPEDTTEPEDTVEPQDSMKSEVTSESEDPTLPQTGQLYWPIPILAAGGLLLYALGCALDNSNRKERRL